MRLGVEEAGAGKAILWFLSQCDVTFSEQNRWPAYIQYRDLAPDRAAPRLNLFNKLQFFNYRNFGTCRYVGRLFRS
jgi:hypothetical protein